MKGDTFHVHLAPAAPAEAMRALVGLRWCCESAASGDPTTCSCWETDYNTVQTFPIVDEGPHVVRPTMCDDCAFRPGSPERTGSDTVAHGVTEENPDGPMSLVRDGKRFHCHDGIRRAVRYRHPALHITIDVPDGAAYEPVVRDGIPYRADGTQAFTCAGWNAHHEMRLREVDDDVADMTDGELLGETLTDVETALEDLR